MQPSSECFVQKIHTLVDAGDYSGACRLHLESLTAESCSSACSRICSSAMKSTACKTVGCEHSDDHRNDLEVEETSDSGYDSAQSYQQMNENNSMSVSSRQSSEPTYVDNRMCLNKTSVLSDAQNTATSRIFHQQSVNDIVLMTKLDDRGICNVQAHVTGTDCGVVSRKLHSPVDFYSSFKCLVTGLQSHADS